jgi:hypothetical protein
VVYQRVCLLTEIMECQYRRKKSSPSLLPNIHEPRRNLRSFVSGCKAGAFFSSAYTPTGLCKSTLLCSVVVCSVVRCRGSHIFETIGSKMAVRLSALRAGQLLVLIAVRGWVEPMAIVRLEGLHQLKTLMT